MDQPDHVTKFLSDVNRRALLSFITFPKLSEFKSQNWLTIRCNKLDIRKINRT